MRYFLKNIAQDSMLRTILLIVLGVAMWVPTFLRQENGTSVVVTLVLTVINTLLATQYFYRGGVTNLPSPFVAATAWFGLSAIPALHTCWQTQLILLGMLLIGMVLLKMDYQHEATEEAFLASLICCIVAVAPSILFIGILTLWGYLIVKRQMTWRVWLASLIALAIRIMLSAVLHYMGWFDAIWMENIFPLSRRVWLLFSLVTILTYLSIYLPTKRPSIGGGVFYLVFIIIFVIANLLWNGFVLYDYPIKSIIL